MSTRIQLLIFVLLTWTGVATVSAQTEKKINSSYGQAGDNFRKSVNGTSVFAGMFREDGKNVYFGKRISQRIEKYQTIVWFHDKFGGPSDEVQAELENWLDQDPERVLIYVGRDFDAELMYWKNALKVAPANQKPDIERQIELVRGRWDTRRPEKPSVTDWFSVDARHEMKQVTSFGGVWAYLLVPNRSEVYRTAEWTIPSPTTYKYTTTEFLTDRDSGQPIITELELKSFTGGRIIVCQNGSSLLNLPLVNSENRKIASLIIGECPEGDVLFLESGMGDPEIADSNETMLGIWSWASKKPLCYIVPHFVLLGIVFCFTFFPIFGRGKKLKTEANTDFANHLQATAELLSHSKNKQLARQKIDYAQSVLDKKNQ